jgi:succinate dehydrogenase / fumarate reductase membrane anchor subunit
MALRTPLARVRGLGPARTGTEDWWRLRLTAVAGIPLVIFLIWLGVVLAGKNHAEVMVLIGNPLVAFGLILSLTCLIIHMRLGMQVIIEDYAAAAGMKLTLVIANTFFAVLIWAAGVLAVLRIVFGT